MAWLNRFFTWLFQVKQYEPQYIPPMPSPVVTETTPEPLPKPVPTPVKTPQDKIYDAAFAALGKHMGLDRTIPIEVNCANALTNVLINAGVQGLPKKGIASTARLYEWMENSKDFKRVAVPAKSDIICYPTGYDDPNIPGMPSLANGHVFIQGKHQLLSNNSKTGKWDNHWASIEAADLYYTKLGGIPRYCFRWNPQ